MEKLKVLVVDDDREIVDSIAIFLRAGTAMRSRRRTTVWKRSTS